MIRRILQALVLALSIGNHNVEHPAEVEYETRPQAKTVLTSR